MRGPLGARPAGGWTVEEPGGRGRREGLRLGGVGRNRTGELGRPVAGRWKHRKRKEHPGREEEYRETARKVMAGCFGCPATLAVVVQEVARRQLNKKVMAMKWRADWAEVGS